MAVQTASGSLNPKKITVILAGNPSTQMDGSGSSFKYEESNSMEAEAMEEYALASAEADYEDPGEQAQMGFMAAGGGFHDEMFLTGGIRNTPNYPVRLAQTIPTGMPRPCT